MRAPFVQLRGDDHWLRASFEGTALVGGAVQLAWEDGDAADEAPAEAPLRGAGLAFDEHCRLYHSLPEAGTVERVLWAAEDPLAPPAAPPPPEPPLWPVAGPSDGGFGPARPTGPLAAPRGLAVDADERLFIAEHGARAVRVVDLWTRRVLRRVRLPGRPLDCAAHGRDVLVATESPAGLIRMTARSRPRPLELPAGVTRPSRLAIARDGGCFVLDAANSAEARVVRLEPSCDRAVPFATDLALYTPLHDADTEGPVLVVARRPGERFLRFDAADAGLAELPGLTARGYDGLGIVPTPDARVAFWTAHGLRYAVAARLRYGAAGRVVGFQLDSGAFQTAWGRLFLDACIPRETDVRVHCIASDEPPGATRLPRTPPVNLPDPAIRQPGESPPLPALALVPQPADALRPVYRRPNGPERPWLARAPADRFATYEAPATDVRGRYLWVVLALAGNRRVTPRVRAVRVEHPGHDMLARLPRVLSREPEVERFLGRFLAPLAGLLGELDARAWLREALLDPHAAPEEALAWLADFLGLALDERWDTGVRRRVIAHVAELFRLRGTVPGLRQFLALVTGVERPIIVEKFRMRGGAVVGEPVARSSRAIVGAGLRVGGKLGASEDAPLAGSAAALEDAFDTHAHRFVVMLPALLSEETIDVAAHVLEVHRPAHTLFELCTVASGMRVARGLHVGLSSVLGRSSGWRPLQVGGAALGRDAIVGRPEIGLRPAASAVGRDARVG